MGFAPTDNGLGMLCRVSQRQVVNVAQHGGLAPLLIGHRPRDLRAPMRAAVTREQARAAAARSASAGCATSTPSSACSSGTRKPICRTADAPRRGAQLGTMEGLRHELLVDDGLGDLIEEVAAHAGGEPGWPQPSSSSCAACGASRLPCPTTW